jgi:S-adenosylmethionine decarboxylase proenzyme
MNAESSVQCLLTTRALPPRTAPAAAIGTQVVLDLYECRTDRLDDIAWVETTMTGAARAAGATIVEAIFHQFAPWGISGVVVISESHLAIHIWPENRYAAVDVFTCGATVDLDRAVGHLTSAFETQRFATRRFHRGQDI